ncbi:MAG: hypothetical protein NC548_48985 [Lachnospiraceae bacterium]|nr:hypothetical protein [Lachnospiraceae bacterium]
MRVLLESSLDRENSAYERGFKDGMEYAVPNRQLTIEELNEMDGKAVWCDDYQCDGIIEVDKYGIWANIPFLVCRINGVNCSYNIVNRELTIYRCRPKEAQKE